jgi:DNA repair exonuclease SbcCD ATPase subunit
MLEAPRTLDTASLIEQALFFAIGFFAALFAAVVATPIFSRRAMRLARTRAQIQAPITEKQAAADRDSLLAMHAVELVRLEQRFAVVEDDAMRLRAAVGRQSAQIIVLEADAAERERIIFDIRSEIDKGVVERHNLEIAVAAGQISLHDAFAQRDRARSNEAAAKVRLGELEAEASRERARIAILAARAENLEELLRSAEAAREKPAKSIAELMNSLATERSPVRELEEGLRRATSEQQSLRESLERAQAGGEEGRRRLAEVESRLQRSERIREEMLIENRRQLAALAESDAALRAAQAKAVELETRLAAISEEARTNESAASVQAQKANTAQAATKGSLRVSRANLEALWRENENLRARVLVLAGARDAADDAVLRTAIEHLGREVSRLFAGQKYIDQDGDDPRERILSAQQDATAIVGSPSAEASGLADTTQRRAGVSHALDR